MFKFFNTLFLALFTLFFTLALFAKNVSLYDQPKSDAKVIGTIDPSTGIVPIFTPKEGDWIKVGNPKNGDVGWIKSSDLVQAGASSGSFSFSQKIVGTDKGPQSYVFQFGVPAPLTKEQTDALYKRIEAQQEAIQKSVQQIIQDTFSHYNAADWNFPIIMPVVVMPPSTATQPVQK